jgi:hypothetical protein
MIIKKELVSQTNIKAWVVKHDGEYFRISQGVRPRRALETFIYKSIVTGKVKDFGPKNELWCTRTLDITEAFEEYLNSLVPKDSEANLLEEK